MNTQQITPGARVCYVPEQNKGDNIHHEATVLSLSKRGANYFRIEVLGKKRTVHRKRLLVGQVDAFLSEDGEGGAEGTRTASAS